MMDDGWILFDRDFTLGVKCQLRDAKCYHNATLLKDVESSFS